MPISGFRTIINLHIILTTKLLLFPTFLYIEPFNQQLSASAIASHIRQVARIKQVNYSAERHWERNDFDLICAFKK